MQVCVCMFVCKRINVKSVVCRCEVFSYLCVCACFIIMSVMLYKCHAFIKFINALCKNRISKVLLVPFLNMFFLNKKIQSI